MKIISVFFLIVLSAFLFSCGAHDESSLPAASELSLPGTSEEETSEECSYDYSDPTSPVYGKLGKKYFELIESGVYCRTTVESRTIGGEAFPYTVTVYRTHEAINVVIEESYGVRTTYIIKDGKLITLDAFQKKAYINEYDGMTYEKPLWDSPVRLKSEGTQMLFNHTYQYETYTDVNGSEFTLYFSAGIPERYKSYDAEKLDTIVIDFTVSDDMSGAVFDIPENYGITDYTK